MSANRINCLNSLRTSSLCEVNLIHQDNLCDWIIDDTFHPAYKYLSYTHRSDYLRCYFSHYHGGGYSDIKHCSFSWLPYFSTLASDPNIFMLGYPERRRKDVAIYPLSLKLPHMIIPGMGQFIFKPRTSLTSAWLQSVHNILDMNYVYLQKYPGTYHPRAINGGVHTRNLLHKLKYCDSQYPLLWNEILGSVLHPLLYSYAIRGISLHLCLLLIFIITSRYELHNNLYSCSL